MIGRSRPGSRLRAVDGLRLALVGLRTRAGRTVLTSLGIAIGIGSLVAVVGLSASSREALVRQIDDLGTNLLSVQPGQDFAGGGVELPAEAPDRIRRIPPVLEASAIDLVDGEVRRSVFDDTPNAVSIAAFEGDVFETLRAELRSGRLATDAAAELPVVVVGAVAAERLGIRSVTPPVAIQVADETRHVVGILEPLPLAEALDAAVFLGLDSLPASDAPAGRTVDIIYLRTAPDAVGDVRSVLAATTNPTRPFATAVQRPSDALEARAQVDEGLRSLLLALGAVALVVGAIGIGNVMIISVLERQGEIGLRRALGAKRHHIATQFLAESSLLALLGGAAGVAAGLTATLGVARQQDWDVSIPWLGVAAAIGVSVAVGVVAGLYPAIRAALLDPAQAVRPGS